MEEVEVVIRLPKEVYSKIKNSTQWWIVRGRASGKSESLFILETAIKSISQGQVIAEDTTKEVDNIGGS